MKFSKLLFLLIFSMVSIFSQAQNLGRLGSKVYMRVVGVVGGETALLNGSLAYNGTGELGFLFNDRFYAGVYAKAQILKVNTVKGATRLLHDGFVIGTYFTRTPKGIDPFFSTQIGAGAFKSDGVTDLIVAITPSLAVEHKFSPFVRAGLGVNYRLVVGSSPPMGIFQASGPGALLYLKIGLFI